MDERDRVPGPDDDVASRMEPDRGAVTGDVADDRDTMLEIAWLPTARSACAGHGSCDEMALRYDCFPGDLVFRTDRWDGSARWGWVQGFDMAMALLDVVAELRRRTPRRTALDLADSDVCFRFERQDSLVSITADWAPGTGRVSLDQLARVVDGFAHEVVEHLLAEDAELGGNQAFATTVERSRRLS